MPARIFLFSAAILISSTAAPAQEPESQKQLAEALKNIDPYVTSGHQRQELRQMLGKQLRERIDSANRASSSEWKAVNSKDEWKDFCASCGVVELELADEVRKPTVHVTGHVAGD